MKKLLNFACVVGVLLALSSNVSAQQFKQNDSGLFTISDKKTGDPIIKDAKTIIVCDGERYDLSLMKLVAEQKFTTQGLFGDGTKSCYTFVDPKNSYTFGLEVTLYDMYDWVSLNVWVRNESNQIISFDSATLIENQSGPCIMNDKDKIRLLAGTTDKLVWMDEAKENGDKNISARGFLGIYNQNTKAELTLGYSITQAWGSFNYSLENSDNKFTATVNMDVDLKPGQTRYAEAVHIKSGNVLEDISELISYTGQEVGAITTGKSLGGWCSWYGFNPFIDNDVTEDVLVEFAEQAAQSDDLPLDLMLLDDGYFTLPGDWTTLRPFFPSGMRYITDHTRAQGLIPGIWIAATLVHENSEAIKKYPDWVDKKADGSYHHTQHNWGGDTHSFDASNPNFLKHIDSLFRLISKDWGYEYLKLDFNVEPSSQRYDRSITSFQAIREMYRVINNAVGEDVFIANCAGIPYAPSIGYAKAGRVGPDVNPNWYSVIRGCSRSILHIPFHRRWWVNDPDCLNMRNTGSQLSDAELQTHVTANYMGGGYVMFSDSLSRLSTDRHRMLAQALPSSGEAATIVDLMDCPEEGIPSILNMPRDKFGEAGCVTAIFNWSDVASKKTVDLDRLGLDESKSYYVFDFWTDSYRGIHKGNYTNSKLPAHNCELLSFTPVVEDKIQIISSSFHLLQGKLEITNLTRMNTSPFDRAKDELWIEMTPTSLKNGKLIIKAGDNLRIAALQGCSGSLSPRKDGLWDLNLECTSDKVAILLRER